MAGRLGEADLTRIARSGLAPLSVDEGLELFDAAIGVDEAVVLPMRLDVAALRTQIEDGLLPAVLRGLVRAPSRRASKSSGSLARRLAAVGEGEREDVVLDVVRTEVATVLGAPSPTAVATERSFSELGFDSLMAIELRNRLGSITGLRLPTTLVFDYPTAAALADYLVREVSGARPAGPASGVWSPSVRAVASDESIAIVGMSCRYPGGVRSPGELWKLVMAGTDAISPFPDNRGWDLEALYDPDPDVPGTCYAREGGFLYDGGDFDAAFFGIRPQEALAMDPQQRQLLEVSWEALESAGIDPTSLRGTQTGVFAGVGSMDFGANLWAAPMGRENLAGYWLTGSSGSIVSGRVSYVLGLEGPAMSVDTACSSSLVALHLACQALRNGECPLALAGGVSVMDTPGLFVQFSGQRGLARDGRCKSFADAADGVGWGEGVGVLLLERLSDAQRNRHRVLALVRGSAINQDGASNGLTAPNGPSQQRVIEQALARAGLSAAQVDAVDGHGTGTTLGDPIEAGALLATYGRERRAGRPLWLGSMKSNIGHTVAAAGVAGVIKMVMAMRHGVLPKTLHVDEPSSKVDWSTGAVALLTETQPWADDGQPRRAGVSSFGVSGTNAHVILEQAPAAERSSRTPVAATSENGASNGNESGGPEDDIVPAGGFQPWLVSAKGELALRGQAQRLLEHLEGTPRLRDGDVGISLMARPVFKHRAVTLGEDREGLLDGLRRIGAGGGQGEGVVHGLASDTRAEIAFLFTGQGAQRVGMGRELYEAFPVFARALDEACAGLEEFLERPLQEVLWAEQNSPGAGLLDQTAFTQMGLFALEVALFRLLQGFGVRPDFLVGHSIGELTAAHVAGVLNLQDACALVASRGQLMQAVPPGGAMVAVQASEQEALETLAGLEDRVALAAVNGPSSIVFSGDERVVLELAATWEQRGRKVKRLQVSHAFHSPQMDSMLGELVGVAEGLTFSAPQIPIISNVTGEPVAAEEICAPAYWARHARRTVRFAGAIDWLGAHGVTHFLELGPDGVLSAMVEECLAHGELPAAQRPPLAGDAAHQERIAGSDEGSGGVPAVVPLLRRERQETRTLVRGLARLWVGGVNVDWTVFEGSGAERVDLPTYAFQRDRYWLDGPAGGEASMSSAGQASADHPLLGAMVELADGEGWLFTGRLSWQAPAWVADHVVMGAVVLPGTAFVEIALHVAGRLECDLVEELIMESPLVLSQQDAVHMQVSVQAPDDMGRRAVRIYSRADDAAGERAWVRHASGVLACAEASSPEQEAFGERAAWLASDLWPPQGAVPVDVEDLYGEMAAMGFEYGPAFLGVRAVWRRGEDLFAESHLPDGEQPYAARYGIHPALFDAAMHPMAPRRDWDALNAATGDSGGSYLPFAFNGVQLHARGASALRVHLSRTGSDAVSMVAADEDGTLVASMRSVVVRAISAEQLARAGGGHRESLFGLDWSALPVSPSSPAVGAGECAVLGEGAMRFAGRSWSGEVYDDLHSLREAVDGGRMAPRVVLFDCDAADLGRLGGEASVAGIVDRVHQLARRVLGLVQEWLADERFAESRLVLVTRGAVSVHPLEDVPGLMHSPVWGLVRSAQSESPGRFMLLDCDDEEASTAALPAALASGEPELAIRAGGMFTPRLERLPSPAPRDGEGRRLGEVGADGTILITGGTSGLGALIARHLVVDHGARNLLLASRAGEAAPDAARLLEELTELGASVRVASCDVAERSQLEELIASVAREHPLRGVVHAAGVLDDGVIGSLTPERLERVLAPKLDGAWHLHELTRDMDLNAFVLFSSVAATLGGPGQANYAAANAFLDALAVHRRANGLAAVAMAWGPWEQATGMTSELSHAQLARIASSGLLTLSRGQGLELFDAAYATERALVVLARLDAAALRTRARGGALPAVFQDLIRRPGHAELVAKDVSGSLAARLADVPSADRARTVLEFVRKDVAAILGHSSSERLGSDATFTELGFDSLAAVELRNRLVAATALRLPASLVFDHPTLGAVARYLLEQMSVTKSAGGAGLDLDRLQRTLSSMSAEDAQRSGIAARLQSILSAWASPDDTTAVEAVDEDLSSVTDDQIFELIDREFGGS
ncbi:MAG TPA: SDR family NAD(P)-dependent oxidoreductase [Solirubrobacteraceae bacterium]|nr:SDR family NAD(P)-dependent oxidoreductase [Solirubrobacteraceae bacterium]